MLSRFYLIPERYGQMDRPTDRLTERQTDRQNCYINIARQSAKTRDKNHLLLLEFIC